MDAERPALPRWKKWVQPPWSTLKTISNNSAAKAAVLVPVFGYWIILNASIAEQLRLAFDAKGYIPSFRLYLTYFGLCFVAVGSLLYQWRCPGEINRYDDAPDFVAQRCEGASRTEWTEIANKVRDGDEVARDAAARIKAEDSQIVQIASTGEARDEMKRDISREWFFHYFEMKDREAPKVREAISVLYAIGFMILGLQSILVFLRVARQLLRQLSS